MAHYAAFDVSDKDTAIHVLDEHGRLMWKGKRASEPEVLATALRRMPRSCGGWAWRRAGAAHEIATVNRPPQWPRFS